MCFEKEYITTVIIRDVVSCEYSLKLLALSIREINYAILNNARINDRLISLQLLQRLISKQTN